MPAGQRPGVARQAEPPGLVQHPPVGEVVSASLRAVVQPWSNSALAALVPLPGADPRAQQDRPDQQLEQRRGRAPGDAGPKLARIGAVPPQQFKFDGDH
ncbi:MAG TPA: hypothetical protein VGC06_12960 [Actinomycetes bacterium]